MDLAHELALAGVNVAKGAHDAALGHASKLELDIKKVKVFMQMQSTASLRR